MLGRGLGDGMAVVDPVHDRRPGLAREGDEVVLRRVADLPGHRRPQLVGAEPDHVPRLGLGVDDPRHLGRLCPLRRDVLDGGEEPGDDGGRDHDQAHLGAQQGGGPQGDQEQQGQEDDGGVPRRERARRQDSAGDRREERSDHDEGDAARPRAGVQIELDEPVALAHTEEGECEHGEIDDGEQAALIGSRGLRRTLVVGEAGDGVDDGREVGRRRPRRAGVLGLVQEGGHPGQEEEAAHAERDQGAPRRILGAPPVVTAQDGDPQPDGGDGDQVQRPVLRVEQCRSDHRHGGHVSQPRRRDRSLQGEEPAAGEQDHQRVHPRLGGVIDGERCAGQQDEGRPGHGPAAESPPAEPGDRERRHADEAGERADGVIGLTEQDDPEMQQDVVQGWCAVVLQRIGDIVQRQAGDVDRQRLIEPEGRPGPEAEGQAGADDEHDPGAGHDAQTAAESGYLLWHGPHGRTRAFGSRIRRRQGGRPQNRRITRKKPEMTGPEKTVLEQSK